LHFTPQLGQTQVTSAFTRFPWAPSTFPTATNSNTTPSGTKCPDPYFALPSIKLEHAWHFTRNLIVSAIGRDYCLWPAQVKHYSSLTNIHASVYCIHMSICHVLDRISPDIQDSPVNAAEPVHYQPTVADFLTFTFIPLKFEGCRHSVPIRSIFLTIFLYIWNHGDLPERNSSLLASGIVSDIQRIFLIRKER